MKYKFYIAVYNGTINGAWWDENLYRTPYQRVTPHNYMDLAKDFEKTEKVFRETISTDILFKGADYEYLYDIFFSADRCKHLKIEITRVCNNDEILYFRGFLKIKKISTNNCTISCTTEPFDDMSCIMEAMQKKVNILQVDPKIIKYNVESWLDIIVLYINNNNPPPQAELDDLYDLGYSSYFYYSPLNGFPGDFNALAITSGIFDTGWYFARELVRMPCGETPTGTGWVVDTDDCGSIGGVLWRRAWTYYFNAPLVVGDFFFDNQCDGGQAKIPNNYPQVIFDNCQTEYAYNVFLKAFNGSTDLKTKAYYQEVNVEIARPLNEVIQLFLDDCGLTFASEFFKKTQNPVSNVMYHTDGLVICHNSDLKRPDATEKAWKYEMSFKDLLDVLKMFNVFWYVDGDNFVIEHLEFFEKNKSYLTAKPSGLDITNNPYVTGTTDYEILDREHPKEETIILQYSDGRDFVGVPITYKSYCVNQRGDENRQEYNFNVCTDLMNILKNPENVADIGITLLSCRHYEAPTEYYEVNKGDGILDQTEQANVWLSVSWLMDRFWRHGRSLINGYMNNVYVTFQSAQTNVEQQEISVPLCCEEQFEPELYVTTSLGDGEVESASRDMKGNVKMKLRYSL